MDYLDKGLVKLEGKTLISHVIERLQNQVENIYISCNRNEDEYQKLGFPLLNDSPFPSEGPLCAIAAGLSKIPCKRLLIVPCDTPLLPENLVDLLNQGLDSGAYKVACIRNHEHIQPLFCMIDSSLTQDLTKQIKAGVRKTQDWIKDQEHILINDERFELYSNINQLSDIENIASELVVTKDS